MIENFYHDHEGQEILILGNGPSAWKVDTAIKKLPAVIGLNQAWKIKYCDYVVMGDPDQYRMFHEAGGEHSKQTLFTTETGPHYAVRIGGQHNDPAHPKRFSLYLDDEGVYLNNTVASFGFQLAVWMLGKKGTIYTLGIDCDGPQFDGSPMPPGTWENQRETLGYIAGFLAAARPGIKVYDLSPVSKQRVFERRKFEEVFG